MARGRAGHPLPKTDFRPLERKLTRHTYVEDGKRMTAKTYSMRFTFPGRLQSSALGLSNLRESTKKAPDVHLKLLAQSLRQNHAPPVPGEPLEAPHISATLRIRWILHRLSH